MTHPYLSVRAEKESGLSDKLVGFVRKRNHKCGWAHWRPAGLCARFYSCLFVPLRLLVSLLALLNLFHRLHRFHVISRELSFEAKPMKADIPNTRVITRVISSRAGSGTPRSARTRSQRSPVHAKP